MDLYLYLWPYPRRHHDDEDDVTPLYLLLESPIPGPNLSPWTVSALSPFNAFARTDFPIRVKKRSLRRKKNNSPKKVIFPQLQQWRVTIFGYWVLQCTSHKTMIVSNRNCDQNEIISRQKTSLLSLILFCRLSSLLKSSLGPSIDLALQAKGAAIKKFHRKSGVKIAFKSRQLPSLMESRPKKRTVRDKTSSSGQEIGVASFPIHKRGA